MPKPIASTRDEWLQQAACRGMNPNLFFPEHDNGRKAYKVDQQAVDACAKCPVVEQCADWAVKHEAHGYQGGLTENQRAQIRKKLNIFIWEPQHNITTSKPTAGQPIRHGTPGGYKQEIKRGLAHCSACTEAHNQQVRNAKAKAREVRKIPDFQNEG